MQNNTAQNCFGSLDATATAVDGHELACLALTKMARQFISSEMLRQQKVNVFWSQSD